MVILINSGNTLFSDNHFLRSKALMAAFVGSIVPDRSSPIIELSKTERSKHLMAF